MQLLPPLHFIARGGSARYGSKHMRRDEDIWIVEASNVGVKVGMVGKGVGGRGVLVGSFARSRGVLDSKGEQIPV
jgi:hypothetical protein